MRITAIHERVVPVRSAMRNAVFDFDEITTSIVAVVLDTSQVGYGFNSTGRYACGVNMRERFIPRVADGTLNRPDRPGIGFERHPALYALMREMA